MNHSHDGSQRTGIFTVAPDLEKKGNLVLDGPKTSLNVWDDQVFDIDLSSGRTITGILEDTKKVSLIGCHISHPCGYNSQGITFHSYSIFSNYAIFGNQYFSEAEANILSISFILDDASTLFHDAFAFGTIRGQNDILDNLVDSKELNRGDTTNDIPLIIYYTGKKKIFSSKTVLGTISAYHSPSLRGEADGIHMKNKIFISLEFEEPENFGEAIDRMWRVVHFFGLVAGRPQNLIEILINSETNQGPQSFDVYASLYPRHQRQSDGFGLKFRSMLIDVARNPSEIACILSAWLDREASWHIARSRFAAGWEEYGDYNPDRIIRVANMFDLLPDNEFPDKTMLPEGLLSLVEETKTKFQKFSGHPDSSIVLSTLGRVGKLTLKQKVHYRLKILLDAIGDQIPEIKVVTDEAVNCRNLYVHGGFSRLSYEEYQEVQIFLTDTLEFVFSASDLAEAGWDIQNWHTTGKCSFHPFASYLNNYAMNLDMLKPLLKNH